MTATILVVDDEADIEVLFRRRFRLELRNLLYSFRFAFSGEEALVALRSDAETNVVLILSDINMPGMSGIELLRELKRVRPELPVIMITAYADDVSRQQSLESGASDFLTKPIDFSELKQRLSGIIDQSGHST